MSPLKKGPGSMNYNMRELVTKPVQSAGREKAILTIAKKHNISYEAAKLRQAEAIAKSRLRQK